MQIKQDFSSVLGSFRGLPFYIEFFFNFFELLKGGKKKGRDSSNSRNVTTSISVKGMKDIFSDCKSGLINAILNSANQKR